ncbi:MAG: hypothetical protein ACR2OY_01210, partial [Boseongicola sp.]
ILTVFTENYENHRQWRRRGVYGSELEVKRDEYISILDRETKNLKRRRLIISAENIWTFKPNEKKNLVSYFRDRDLNVKAVCYVREFQSYAASAFQQSVKGGLGKIKIVKTEHRNRLEPFRKLIDPDQFFVRKFDRENLKNGCVVQDFCDLVGIHPKRVINSNESLSVSALKLMFLFNRKGPLSENDSRLKVARNKLVKRLDSAYPGTKPDNRLFRDLVPDWKDDYRYLEEQFGISFPPPDQSEHGQLLEEYLTDLSGLDLGPLDTLLTKNDVDPLCFSAAEDKLSVLYYAILAGFKSPPVARPRKSFDLRRIFGSA